MTNTELFRILSKQWANVKDIRKIASCGRDNATNIRNSIIEDIKSNNLRLPVSKNKIVPMTYVIRYLNLDIEHIALMAQKEKLI